MKFRRKLSPDASINFVPMIDVVFQLIIFFMVVNALTITAGIPVLLPASTTAEQVAMTKLVVTVISSNEIYLNVNKIRYSLNTLSDVLAGAAVKKQADAKGVIIEGDSRVSYSLMVGVLDVLRHNGYKVANLKTRPTPAERR
jgi:biopolymer transport protein ExbD